MTATKTDVVYWLRRAANEASDGVLVGSDLLIDAADEIDYLRFAIAAWAEAEDALDGYTVETVDPAMAKAYYDSWSYLRKAVGLVSGDSVAGT